MPFAGVVEAVAVERGAPWDCPADCGCADRDDATPDVRGAW